MIPYLQFSCDRDGYVYGVCSIYSRAKQNWENSPSFNLVMAYISKIFMTSSFIPFQRIRDRAQKSRFY